MFDLDTRDVEAIVNGTSKKGPAPVQHISMDMKVKKKKEREYAKFKLLNHVTADLSWLMLGVASMCCAFHIQCGNDFKAGISLVFIVMALIFILIFDVKEGKI